MCYFLDNNLRITHVITKIKNQIIEKTQVCLNVHETFNILAIFS